MPDLILWDIDGTLVRGGGAANDAYHRALRQVYRLDGEIARVDSSGKTDGQIVLETLARHGFAAAEVLALLAELWVAYTTELDGVRARLAAEIEVLPGVRPLLTRLEERGLWQSLLTGNIAAAARIKLASAGLEAWFDFAVGAFGDDHHDRDQLVPIAIGKASAHRALTLRPERVVVIGDTPRDIACARAGGARVVAVATGRYATTDLAAHRPDVLLESLADTERALAAVLDA